MNNLPVKSEPPTWKLLGNVRFKGVVGDENIDTSSLFDRLLDLHLSPEFLTTLCAHLSQSVLQAIRGLPINQDYDLLVRIFISETPDSAGRLENHPDSQNTSAETGAGWGFFVVEIPPDETAWGNRSPIANLYLYREGNEW
jgi:hypothetical protein